MPDPTPQRPTPDQVQARVQAIAEAGHAAITLLANHAAVAGLGVTIVIATNTKDPIVLNSCRADVATEVLAVAAEKIKAHAQPVQLIENPGDLDLRKLRLTEN